jgi:hypothetical protein
MMRLTPEAMKRLFYPTIEKIKATIGEVLNSPEVKGKFKMLTALTTHSSSLF